MIIGKDCWIRLQDWNKLEYKIDCIEVTSPSKAVADVISTDTWQTPEGEKRYTSKIRLDLVFENDNWVIDDFTDKMSQITRSGCLKAPTRFLPASRSTAVFPPTDESHAARIVGMNSRHRLCS